MTNRIAATYSLQNEIRIEILAIGTFSTFTQSTVSKSIYGNKQSVPEIDTLKKFYIKASEDTPKFDKCYLPTFISNVTKLDEEKSKSLIDRNSITINGDLVTDYDYDLKSGDIVRVGILGHYINDKRGIAIVN